jgi:exopolysaccharide biosynthesis polyprenyl glycosylphosphotransferase
MMTTRRLPRTKELPTGDAPTSARDRGAFSGISLPGIGLRRSERLVLLFSADFLWLCAALIIAVKLRSTLLDQPGAVFAYWRWFVALGVVWWVVAHLLDCYDLARAASASNSMVNTGIAAAITVLVYQWIPVFSPPLQTRSMVFVFGVLAVIGVALWRGFYARAFAQPSFQRRALVLGAGASGKALLEAIEEVPDFGNPYAGTGYEIVGFVDDDPAKINASSPDGIPVLGDTHNLPQIAQRTRVDDIVVAVTHRHTLSQSALDALLACREQGLTITTMPALYEHLLGRVPVEHVGGDLAAVLPMRTGPTDRLFKGIKRLMDIGFAIPGLLLFGLLMPFLALGNAVYNPGPMFYRQTRVGRGGRNYTVVKLRSMLPDAEKQSGAVWSTANDARITPFGKFLRKSRLDELPQFWNVLKGEMSVIGPRPERPEFVNQLAAQIPFYRARHAVKPGITGWAQVRYGYGSSVDDSRVKLEYDLYYVRHSGFYLDLLIAMKTVGEMLRLKGR